MNMHRDDNASSIMSGLHSIWASRGLLFQLWQRDFAARYRNGILGVAWALLNPLLMLGLYSFLFIVVFKMRWSNGPSVDGSYALLLFTGLIVHGFFGEFVTRAPSLIVSHSSYVKKVVFPLELLPLIPLLGAFINFVIGTVLVSLFLFVLQGSVPWTVVLFPLVTLPFAIMMLGISYFLSATGIYIRDLAQIAGLVSTVAMYGSPVLFPIETVSPTYRKLLYFNPITTIVEQVRDIMILGVLPDWRIIGIYTLVASCVFLLGLLWFQFVRKGFADVL